MSVIEVLNASDHAILRVYSGICGRLRETGDFVAVPKAHLPKDYENCALQISVVAQLYWILHNGSRYCNKVFCSLCSCVVNGSGSNLRMHASTHRTLAVFTDEQRVNAFLLFLIRHQIGLTTARDPFVRIFQPNVSFSRLISSIEPIVRLVVDHIRSELQDKEFFIMVDGWSDQSLRRYLGVVAGFYSFEQNNMVLRFLDLYSRDGQDHSAQAQKTAVYEILERYSLRRQSCSCLVSDSASVNTRLADDLNLDWCPCTVHLWNLVVNNFFDRCPDSLTALLSRINRLRKKARWVEFLVGRSSHRNIAGYCATRWCSACECLKSFYDHRNLVFEYFEQKENPFSTKDIELVKNIGPLLERFTEVNDILIQADHNEGLASVFETVSAIYLILHNLAHQESDFQSIYQACATEIKDRFFNLQSKFCCRLIFSGLLNVKHSIPEWMMPQMEYIVALLVSELELFTGATPPGSPQEEISGQLDIEIQPQRYSPNRPISATIADSPAGSEASGFIYDEVREFLRLRSELDKANFTVFWQKCTRFRHLSMLALKLRRYPTSTVWLERCFSRARRILSWSRMRMSTDTARKLCLLTINETIAEHALGLGTTTPQQDEQLDDEFFEEEVLEDQESD